MSGATGRRNRALKVTCLRSVHVRDARQLSLAKPAGHVSDIARWRRPHHGVRGRDRGIESALRQARGQRRLELIGVQQPREPIQHRGRRRDAQPGPRADTAAVPGQQVLVPAAAPPAPRRARTPRPRPSPIPATAADAASPAASTDPSGGPPATPAGTRDPVPSRQAGGGECSRQATMRTRARSCRCWSVRVGTRIITTGRAPTSSTSAPQDPVSRAAPSRVTLPQSNQRKVLPDSCEAPTLLVTHRHTDFDESLSAHRHFENKSASIEVRYGPM